MDQVRERLKQSNEKFLSEVNKGTDYWKKIQDEEFMLQLGIAEKLDEANGIIKKSHAEFMKRKRTQ